MYLLEKEDNDTSLNKIDTTLKVFKSQISANFFY